MGRNADNPPFSEVVAENYDRIFRGALCVSGDPSLAEDIAQETFLSALRAYSGFQGKSGVFTWLYRIMLRVHARGCRRERLRRRLGIAAARANGTRPMATDRMAPSEVASPPVPSCLSGGGETSPSVEADREEDRERLRTAVRRLPPKLQAVVSMHYFDEMPLEEIAEVLQCPTGTVKSRLFHARARLLAALKDCR